MAAALQPAAAATLPLVSTMQLAPTLPELEATENNSPELESMLDFIFRINLVLSSGMRHFIEFCQGGM